MTLRAALSELLQLDDEAFLTRFQEIVDEYDLSTPATVEGAVPELPTRPPRTSLETELVRRIRRLDEIPLGLTLSGPAYEDNPLIYANRTLRQLTGYALEELNDRNLRLLQGPETESDPVVALREALANWEPVTVTLTNYRADGTSFRNTVSLVPIADDTGTVANWVGIQEAV